MYKTILSTLHKQHLYQESISLYNYLPLLLQIANKKILKFSYLISKNSNSKFARKKCVQYFANNFSIRTTRNIGFETDIRKFWFWCDMDGHVTALK